MRLKLCLVYLQFEFQLSRTIFRRLVRFLVDGRDRTSADVDRRMNLNPTFGNKENREAADEINSKTDCQMLSVGLEVKNMSVSHLQGMVC